MPVTIAALIPNLVASESNVFDRAVLLFQMWNKNDFLYVLPLSEIDLAT
jgi:hypothetical protein